MGGEKEHPVGWPSETLQDGGGFSWPNGAEILPVVRSLQKQGVIPPDPQLPSKAKDFLRRCAKNPGEKVSSEELQNFLRMVVPPEVSERLEGELGEDLPKEERTQKIWEQLKELSFRKPPEQPPLVEEGEVLPEEKVPPGVFSGPPSTPLLGDLTVKIRLWEMIVGDPQARELSREMAREWLQIPLSDLRERNNRQRLEQLKRLRERAKRVLGKDIFKMAVETWNSQHPENPVSLETLEGWGQILPMVRDVLGEILSLPEGADEEADRRLALQGENTKKMLALARKEREEAVRLAEIQTEINVAKQLEEGGDTLRKAEEISAELTAIKEATGAKVVKQVVRTLGEVPLAFLGGALNEAIEEVAKLGAQHPAVGGAVVLTSLGSWWLVAVKGVPPSHIWFPAFCLIVGVGMVEEGWKQWQKKKKEEKKSAEEAMEEKEPPPAQPPGFSWLRGKWGQKEGKT
jgi:hypothetical protein